MHLCETNKPLRTLLWSGLFLALTVPVGAANIDQNQLQRALQWRSIGPSTGGRVTAVAGVPGQPLVYYMGSTGGGVWKSEDGGLSWAPISDPYFRTGSIGAIAVAPSDANVLYVGTGEACLRNDISHGDGVYKSEDAGKTWRHIGLDQSRHISRIRVDPQDPDRVYVAALGPVFGPGQQRGVFRSDDGGENWRRVLFVDEKSGASDLNIDPHNPRILYAGMWQVLVRPWGIYSGGPASGLYKSTDFGESWTELSRGLPAGSKGRIGVAASPAQPGRVWALIEAEDGGLYRSDDSGQSWSRINDDFQLRRRHYYYTHVFADTQDPETVYVLTSPFMKSVDGGRSFRTIRVPHGDTHDLWIAPEDNQRLVGSNDGGANVSFNGGAGWTRTDNQVTRQLYHVTTDNQFPYRVYGAQQDGSTISVPSRGGSFGGVPDRFPVGGGESGYIAVHPENSNIVYAGTYWGRLTRYDHSTGATRNISVSPELPAGRPAADWTYRFNWSFPVLLSPHDPRILYAAGNILFKTINEGESWEAISPDLTRNDKSKQQDGRLSQIYNTIFTVAESPVTAGVIWVGTDDGLVQLTLDGGESWREVTPPGLPEWSRISLIDASPHAATTAYLAANRWDLGDPEVYLYRTRDYGQSWQSITQGIEARDFVRTVREDPVRQGLLFAGTETGVYFSLDEGAQWQRLQLNLPAVPVHDVTIKNNDLVIATHGRSFWILDNISPLRQWQAGAMTDLRLLEPATVYRFARNTAQIDFYLPKASPEPVILEILDESGQLVQRYQSARGAGRSANPGGRRGGGRPVLRAGAGLNRFQWDLRYPDAKLLEGEPTFLFGGSPRGPVAVPGSYQVRLTALGSTQTTRLTIAVDPRTEASQADLEDQFNLLIKIRDAVSRAHTTASRILKVRSSLRELAGRLPVETGKESLLESVRQVDSDFQSVLGQLVELRFRGIDDQMLEYPLQLNNKIASLQGVVASADAAPTQQARQEFENLSQQLAQQLARFGELVEKRLPELNRQIRQANVPAVPIP